jgi:hypothetical protein
MVGVSISDPKQPKSANPTSSSSTIRTFARLLWSVSGHQGVESATLLAMVP